MASGEKSARAVWHTRLLIAGGFLLPFGVVVILMGWYGAAHTSFPWEQNSYLLSGGVLGLSLVMVGGFFYFGAWIARLVESHRVQTDRLIEALEKAAVGAAGDETGAQVAPVGTLVATKRGTLMHRRDCAVVASSKDVRVVSPDEEGLKPCRLCDPLGERTLHAVS